MRVPVCPPHNLLEHVSCGSLVPAAPFPRGGKREVVAEDSVSHWAVPARSLGCSSETHGSYKFSEAQGSWPWPTLMTTRMGHEYHLWISAMVTERKGEHGTWGSRSWLRLALCVGRSTRRPRWGGSRQPRPWPWGRVSEGADRRWPVPSHITVSRSQAGWPMGLPRTGLLPGPVTWALTQ